ncbi:hypothetical protein I7I48_11751 [Histoplasma ohiense]|nr:hypothetical protein I7I48_11751 [Histoplasma ohiense (nom. inval.)]
MPREKLFSRPLLLSFRTFYSTSPPPPAPPFFIYYFCKQFCFSTYTPFFDIHILGHFSHPHSRWRCLSIQGPGKVNLEARYRS